MMTEDDHSTEFSLKDDRIEKDHRRVALLNDPNYGIILCFLDKFRAVLDLPPYSLQRLEDHLLNSQERISPRLIDFHFILLKRLSLAKNTQREKFDSIITKFAFRFDLNDGDHLTTTGYLQADINIKTRILKNLLESQFDLNQTFKNTLVDKSAREIKPIPIGRDRFGTSYWLFMDTDCFVHLFREDVDIDRTWSNVAKDREELEKFIQLLITDSIVRKKFADWTVDYEPFASLLTSNEFELYSPPSVLEIQEEENESEIKKTRGRTKAIVSDGTASMEIDTTSSDDEKVDLAIKRKRGRPKTSLAPVKTEPKQIDLEIKPEEEEATSNDKDELNESMGKKRGRPKRSIKEEDVKQEHQATARRSGRTKRIDVKIKNEEESEKSDTGTKKIRGRPKSLTKAKDLNIKEELLSPVRPGRKRKILTEESDGDENDKLHDESSVDNTSLSIRRSARPRKAPPADPTFVVASKSNTQNSAGRKKRSVNGKSKSVNDLTTNKSSRSRRGRKATSRRNYDDEFCFSNSSSNEHLDYLSEDDYDSDDYLPNPSQNEHDENFFELDEDNNPTGEELRTAKTAQDATIITACHVCLKSDRPEVLLLCDDCDDAYHVECLRPKLLSVPDGDWFCPLCEHKKLSHHLIDKLKELLINYNLLENKRLEHQGKKSLQRKIKRKEYTSDESITASESEHENFDSNLHADDSMLSLSQTNENSNISSSHFDDSTKNISQRGRHRRTRFDMNKMLNNDEESNDDDNSDTNEDDEYIENPPSIANFDLQIPKKMTRLLSQRYRPLTNTNDQRLKPKPIAPRFYATSVDLNEKLGSPIIYINGDGGSHQIKSVITNSNQTLKIVRRWNDVQRRNKLRTNHMKLLSETTSDCADDNSVFCPDDTSPPRSNESNHLSDMKDEDSNIIRSKVTLGQSANLLPIYKSSTKNLVKKNEVNFDRLTRDIQYAVSEANTLPTTPKAIDQQNIKRIQKTNFSPYSAKAPLRPLPVILPKPAGVGYKIFKSKDPPSATDLSNIILTPSSSSSLLDGNDEQSTSTINT